MAPNLKKTFRASELSRLFLTLDEQGQENAVGLLRWLNCAQTDLQAGYSHIRNPAHNNIALFQEMIK